jgi:hypothetical protein
MLETKADVLVLLDAERRARGLLTAGSFVEWTANGAVMLSNRLSRCAKGP